MTTTLQPPKSIPNFRDVGAFINHVTGTKRLKTGLLYRGARPDEATVLDRDNLVKEYGMKSIIDLRTKTEHIEQAQKRDAHIKASAAVPQSNEAIAGPLKIPGINYYDINFNGSAFSRMLISKLSWIEFFRLIGLMAIGRRLDAIKILAPSMEAMGLVGLGTNSLDVCTKEVKEVFDVYGDEKNWPLMIHCTQGKDRTGLTVMLVLFLLGVDVDAAEQDYLRSGPELESEREERIQEISKIGLSETFANVDPDMASKVHEHLESKYGGVEGYLAQAGVTEETRTGIRKLLLADVN
ncbi:tyrosine/serine phosphatase-like protein [Pleomassaria siparia CBS 279.74]|uniref:Tyrosine/serine phosphatase-like protein n=1 Tax=Pleomassaria siparia CBS 279.74 TaxID=1314801 RepID=A0A6G1KBV3_9PLEO|nr:tyrosine/serine phosphatase-like protein [Pleomassaria siparia CBS 279.74]